MTDYPELAHCLTEGPALALGTETTGRDPATARLVQLALVLCEADGTTSTLACLLVDPACEIPAEAAAVHGVTAERLAAAGPFVRTTAQAAAQVWGWLDAAQRHGVPVIAYNAPYDLGVLRAEGARAGLEPMPEVAVLDPLVIDRRVDRYRKGSRQLGAVAEHYGIQLGDAAHDAAADARAAGQLARVLLDRNASLHGLAPADLHDMQAGWHAEWLDSFNAYRARRGQGPATGGWPYPENGEVGQ